MSKNDKFYTGKGTMQLLKEFRAVAGCRSIEQAVDAVFLIAATMTADRIAKLKYHAANEQAPAWSLVDAVEENLFSPAFGELAEEEETEEVPMTPNSHWQLGYMTANAEKISGLDVDFSDALILAVLMAKDVHDKFGHGQTIKIPVDPQKGNPLFERHIHLA